MQNKNVSSWELEAAGQMMLWGNNGQVFPADKPSERQQTVLSESQQQKIVRQSLLPEPAPGEQISIIREFQRDQQLARLAIQAA